MKDDLAQALLAKIMNWTDEEDAAERSYLQVMGAYKYDEYQQFSPGMRFIESLAHWLKQFDTAEERKRAYDFVKNRMIFISRAEMEHLVTSAYPDIIRYYLIERAAAKINISPYMVTRITQSTEFKVLLRQSLFLGMSDGAHTDIYRRKNVQTISYEQVYQTYEISEERAKNMLDKLRIDLTKILGREPSQDEIRFKMAFLLDDFSATGITYLRQRAEDGTFTGKIVSFYDQVTKPGSPLMQLIDIREASIFIILYLCTESSASNMSKRLGIMCEKLGNIPVPEVRPVYRLDNSYRLTNESDSGFLEVISQDRYYDGETLKDKHTELGGSSLKYGFGECYLPIVLSHNTPNDSISHLWSYEWARFRGLFPRLPRHWEGR
jgi:hypothetical protein